MIDPDRPIYWSDIAERPELCPGGNWIDDLHNFEKTECTECGASLQEETN